MAMRTNTRTQRMTTDKVEELTTEVSFTDRRAMRTDTRTQRITINRVVELMTEASIPTVRRCVLHPNARITIDRVDELMTEVYLRAPTHVLTTEKLFKKIQPRRPFTASIGVQCVLPIRDARRWC
jgi:hypothetical protein